MAGRRGSATVAVAVFCLLVVAFHCLQVAQATRYVVGDSAGWSKNVAGWTKGKSFKEGDMLVFNYKQGAHNVLAVRYASFRGCNKFDHFKTTVYATGKDELTVFKGENIYICGFPGQCDAGMKLVVNAS